MSTRVILPYRDILVRVLDDRTTVMIHVQIIRSGKDGDDRRELFERCFSVHSITGWAMSQ